MPRPGIVDYQGLVTHLASDDLKLSPRLRQVAQFVLNHPEDVAIYNIVELARMADVPTSTLTRFTKEIGFSGFAELQTVFRQRLLGPRGQLATPGEATPPRSEGAPDLDSPDAVLGAFVQAGIDTLTRLEQDTDRTALSGFVEAIVAADTVHIIAARGAFGVGAYCFYGLSQMGVRANLVDNIGAMRAAQSRFIRPEDAVIAITFDDYTPETVALAQQTVERNLRLLAITDNELSPIAGIGAHTLFVREARLGHFRSQIPAMALCQSIIVSAGRRIDRAPQGASGVRNAS
ncbi:MurR/RpiR family transcriptional regulator [Oceaniglobus trochenteri]|uniref:MurR/RpiR family transcriptional regulator n=1 Tax=Oceaniglobus trochenteri TaxID=2763260 RepID=UPI001CFFB4FF|nr:MurR/RpiR family transcriptional regulator [Oceaniglobus trochenteri]